MKSICIKTNNSEYIDYLLNELKLLKISNLSFSYKEFKNYKNVILHYKGTVDTMDIFFSEIASILSLLVIDMAEKSLLKKSLNINYFYFSCYEKNNILDICNELNQEDFIDLFDTKFNILYNAFYSYLSENRNLFLDGFINFRIKDYLSIIDNTVDEAVNNFLIEKEYAEFINLLRAFISSSGSMVDVVYLIYSNDKPILLDKNKENINILDSTFKTKYLSDISFSANDYVLNCLLTLLPEKIYLYSVNNYTDEFVDTLKNIFENRLVQIK